MSDYKEQANSLREHADLIETSIELYGPSATRLLVYDLRNAAATIESLQAQLPKRGKWEREMDVNDEPFYQCSVCGECFDFNRDSTHEVFKYCPDCGAKMEVQDAEM